MRKLVLVLFFVISALAQDNFESSSVQLALKIYDDCSKMDGLSVCLKKKAVTFIDRLGRMDKLALSDGIVVHKTADAPKDGPAVTEDQLDQTLPRSSDAKDEALTEMLMDKIGNFVGSRSIEVALPKISVAELIEEGRKGDFNFGGGGGGGKGKKKGGKKGGMMGGMMMLMGAKMAALIPIFIGGLFLLAKKALITAKIALLISGIIAIKKLFGSKKGGGGGGGHGGDSGWQSGGGGGGWQSGGGGGGGGWQSGGGGGGGWDKRSYNEVQSLAYNAYSPKQ
ncbi:unnamed protein product [Psylliodes chrysocephalus]|uniref:Uncharacterized protein n=1 Tax=Psylliodes chrysocephalus TaxID=3402493 RepID=A0A9P0CXG7_9CUCU|nr:unnamed protein product [Psylliodes chrysocephala]